MDDAAAPMMSAGSEPAAGTTAKLRHWSVALCCDPIDTRESPPRTRPVAIPSHGENLNAVIYGTAGNGLHPTVLILHGLPGNEQNLDCAQSIRRAGWNVVTIHYRGSWGGPGTFSFEHCIEDAAATCDWLCGPSGRDHGVDPKRLVVIGHSMGGFVAAHIASERRSILGAALISGVDLGAAFGGDMGRASKIVDDNVGVSAGLHILSGASPGTLVEEAGRNASRWSLAGYASRLGNRPLLAITSNDGFAPASNALTDAIQASGGSRVVRRHFATDHSYSGSRIALQIALIEWLASFNEAPLSILSCERGDDVGHRD